MYLWALDLRVTGINLQLEFLAVYFLGAVLAEGGLELALFAGFGDLESLDGDAGGYHA